MINKDNIISIEKLLNNKKIIGSEYLSDSFGINCIKIFTNDSNKYVVKFYREKNTKFNAIKSETKNLMFFQKNKIKFFPVVQNKDNNFLVMSFIDNNKKLPKETKEDFLNANISIHEKKNNKYGFDFDTQIGGLKQINKKSNNWVDFYRDYRLAYIYELINKYEPMDLKINKKIELLLKKLGSFIPKNPSPSLLHGDLWEGNILFNDKKFAGFIDPGTFYGHNELEIAYLRWFNPDFIKKNFIEKYNDIIPIDKEYYNYEPIYQLYYSLLNVYLWDRNYVKDVESLLIKIKI